MINHLWQSTWFALAAGALTLAFRANRASLRHWLWFSASVKFLIPFALLIGLRSAPGLLEPGVVVLDRAVIDKTGITGTFDIHVNVSAGELADDARDSRAPLDETGLIFAAVRKMGLKLESAKGTGQVLVIEHVEKPSEN
jgi:hypothetical protein